MVEEYHIYPELIESFRGGQACLFVGAGASKAAGLQTWDELIDDMKATILAEVGSRQVSEYRRFFENANKLEIAEAFRELVGRRTYYEFLRRRYRRRGVKLSPLHQQLRRLPIKTIFTTNYDKLLERTFRSEEGGSKGAFGHHLPHADQGPPFRGSLSSTYEKEIAFGAGHPLIGS